ncbi:nonribosomal peptide synthetase-like protein 2 [Sporormia fimetaria CBS 119925]|uniref:Nonribosomal peptide synthetase-like protein 2 n=1 Tax=Sporormia fimetaria CBS 119925 TaxID=1340428 RepID=A0A6A6VFP0_9PLEO|nr:nonribosomal peptide synthetase-like protein 2 [Sporormia fimetaria CBS 119925]
MPDACTTCRGTDCTGVLPTILPKQEIAERIPEHTPPLSILNPDPVLLPGPGLLHDLIRQSFRPADIAIDFLEDGSRKRLSYEALHSWSDQLANEINCTLAEQEHASIVIPIFLPQCPALYVSILAILKAGRAFCPLSLDTPKDRLRFIFDDLGATLVVSSAIHCSPFFAENNIKTINALGNGLLRPNQEVCSPRPRPANIAYVLYTSGSTGLPKAVAVSHKAVTQSLLAHDRHIPPFKRFLQFAAPTFDVSIFEIFFPLFRGQTVVGCSRAHMLNDLPTIINEMDVDAAELTPTVVTNLLRGRKSVPGLRLLLTIGEMLTQRVVEEFGGDSMSSILWGMYGPTEAAIHCTLQPKFPRQSSVGSIGIPLDTVSAYIMEPATKEQPCSPQILPLGEIGELVLGGHQIAEGYLNRPELTEAAYVSHPELGRLYRTGDKAKMLKSGRLECLGRIVSGQVKVRGQRVELGEIEHSITRINGCHNAVALVIDGDLVAFYSGSDSLVEREVIESCKRWLPSHMVPTKVVRLASMPLLPSGKVDKRALEQTFSSRGETNDVSTASTSIIHRVLQDVLRHSISPGTAFSSLGLDSLRAIQISSRLRTHGYDLMASDVLSARNMEDLISVADPKPHLNGTTKPQAFDNLKLALLDLPELAGCVEAVCSVIPCTPLQEAMLVESRRRPGLYCNWIEIELPSGLSFERIQGMLMHLAAVNSVLRSGFFHVSSSTGSFVQVTWKDLQDSQIREVTQFSKQSSSGSPDWLRRPLDVQVNTTLRKPRVLFHMHHALYDGWSLDLLLRDINNLIVSEQLSTRPQYEDVVRFYLGPRYEREKAVSAAYWANVIEGYTPSYLPNFNGRIVHNGSLRSTTRVSSVRTHQLFACAERCAVSPQTFFQAALLRMLSYVLDSPDVVIGSVISGRNIPIPGVENIVGPCIASLPLRINVSRFGHVMDVLRELHVLNRGMLQHCALPLRDIGKMCGLRPGTSLFDVLFIWQESPYSYNGNSAARIVDQVDALEYKLTVEIEPRAEEIAVKATYDSGTLPMDQVQHLLQQIDDIVDFFVEDPQRSMEDILNCFQLSSLSVANPFPAKRPVPEGPTHCVERWAAETPEAEAIAVGTKVNGVMTLVDSVSYATLNARANQLAWAISEYGISNDELICVYMEKSVNLYVSILAVLKLGCGYLPIVPESPLERTSKIIAEAGIRLCLSESPTSKAVRDMSSCNVVDVDLLDLCRQSERNPRKTYNGSHLAYAVFTSGSTGTPKGVLVTQDNLMSNIEYLFHLYPTSRSSRLLQSCSQAFDVSVFEIFFTWYAGMCLCTAGRDDLYSDLEHSINRLGVTHLSMTPTVAALVNPERVPRVTFLVTAGEALNEHVRRQWAGKGLYQGKLSSHQYCYGPSETTNICTIRGPVTNDDLINNIGAPFQNTSAFVLEPDSQRLLPRGAIGELCFGGLQVFRGYMNLPDLNARKIIDHPQYGRIYRSGDMGLLLPDDSILFTGRSDDLVKIRGQRVELGEITAHILDNPEVEDCITLLLRTDTTGERLISFWVPKNSKEDVFAVLEPTSHQSVIQHVFQGMQSKLPSYMIPTHLVPISRMPLTAQVKIDKRILYSSYRSLSAATLEPATHGASLALETGDLSGQEDLMARILSETVKVPLAAISRTSSFFNLGLDSISAMQFSRALLHANVAEVSVSAILKNASLAALSRHCSQAVQQHGTDSVSLDRISEELARSLHSLTTAEDEPCTVIVKKIRPCTPLQEAMLAKTLGTQDLQYCNIMTFNLTGDVRRLRECWNEMFKRHEILRTAFVATSMSRFAFAQVVQGYQEPEWRELSSAEDNAECFSLALRSLLEARRPPVRLATRRVGCSTQLVFTCHHALYDGVAILTLLREVERLYHGERLPPPISYDHYLRHMIAQDASAGEDFWVSKLEDMEPCFFPVLNGGVANSRVTEGSLSTVRTLQLPLKEILRFCQSAAVSLLPLVQAAWAKLLYFYSGDEDICFGNIVSGRTLPGQDLDSLVAPCFNTLPVRARSHSLQTNMELVRQLHDFNIESLPFQLTPLRRINNRICEGQGYFFNSLLILQQPSAPLDASVWTLEADEGPMDVPIVCEVHQETHKNSLRLTLHYHSSLLSRRDADIVAETFDLALHSIINHPEKSVTDTSGFPSAILAISNPNFTILEPNEGVFLHSAFEDQARWHPDHVALDFEHPHRARTIWSYAELNEHANQIAHALMGQGIGKEDMVPLHMAKGPSFYASILGVLKAGAAFAPILPDLPSERKRFMLSELRPKLLLHTGLGGHSGIQGLDVTTLGDLPTNNPVILGMSRNSLAYCLYTSGSTGLPKAVSMEHYAPIQTIKSARDKVPWTTGSRLLQYAAVSFDMCYFDCFLAWSCGFTLCAAEQSSMLNDVGATIRSLNVDLVDLTPSVATTLAKSEVPSVRWLYCIGEPMTSDIVQEWGESCVNSYGPTEAAFCTTMYCPRSQTSANIIGEPFSSTCFTVLPPDGKSPLPVFGLGELCIGGAQLARGYLGRAELTAQKFITRDGNRLYKTGDMVRMLADGNFEFVGRTDDQVKIRGLRVELGEINNVIQAVDDRILGVTTQILRKNTSSKPQLVAFIVLPSSHDAQRDGVKSKAMSEVAKFLPAYMAPNFYIFLDAIPKSSAGKVDKNALENVFRSLDSIADMDTKPSQSQEYVWTETELQVRRVFARLSRTPLENIHPGTTIYQLGMDSISAVQIAAALRQEDCSVTATDVLKHMSSQALGHFIDHAIVDSSASITSFDFEAFDRQFRPQIVKSGIDVDTVETVRPCTPLQTGIISQFISSDGALYLNYIRMRLQEGTDVTRLRHAWTEAAKAHPILRTGFVHLRHAQPAMAMVTYTDAACELSWKEEVDVEATPVDHWLEITQRKASENLLSPPWSIRVVHEGEQFCLDLAMLHALYDAQSIDHILEDVVAVYEHSSVTSSARIEPALGNILHLSSKENTASIQFWERVAPKIPLTRFPNLAPLRFDPAPPGVISRVCAKPLVDLELGCRRANITLQTAGLAAWMSILSGYTGESSAACGLVLSGRAIEGAASVVFPCITTVPIVCNLNEDKRKVLEQLRAITAEVLQHQYTPLHEIQRLAGHPTEPLFDTIFTFQKIPVSETRRRPWEIVDEKASVEYPVSIELEPKGDELEMRLTFQPHIIPEPQAVLILQQLEHLLGEFIFLEDVQPREKIYDNRLYSITPAKETMLHSEVHSEVALLHELVEVSAFQVPDSIALEFATCLNRDRYASNTWTYAEFNAQGNRVANYLLAHGAQPGSMIGVCFDKCPEAYSAILGTLKAGCAFVAIDPGAPVARQTFILKDSAAKMVLSTTSFSSELKNKTQATVIDLDTLDLSQVSAGKPTLQRPIDPQDCSYCLYTSGTTGTPKGCEITHENVVQALLSFQRIFKGHWDDSSRWLQFASFHFDVSVLEQYWTWSVGIRLVSAPRDLIFDDLANTINVLGVTHIDLTPSLARLLHPDDVPSLCRGVFITGGESLKQEILDVWGPKGVIYNFYGPTEATIGCTVQPRVPYNGKPSNIGQQWDNVGTFVLTPGTDLPVFRGALGELCVSGKLVGKGYLNRPELTKERFAWLQRFDTRVYCTGDMVRLLHDGSFDFAGRADDQVKLRGQRLEIGEINSVIKGSDNGISDVATLVLKHEKQQKEQLVSFVAFDSRREREPHIILQPTKSLDAARDACHEKLPGYMVPTHFLVLSAMPLSTNNKADHKKLKEMYAALSVTALQELSAQASGDGQALSDTERRLSDVIAEFLHLEEKITKRSSLFELGLDSIAVIGLARALKQAGFSKATASIILKDPSVSRLAKALSKDTSDDGSVLATQQEIAAIQHRSRGEAAKSLGISAGDIEALAPCTPLQQGIIARALNSEQGAYFNSFHFKLSDTVNVKKLELAWRTAFDSVQILRTAFVGTRNGIVQAVPKTRGFPWCTHTSSKRESLSVFLKRLRKEWWLSNRSELRRPFELHFVKTLESKVLAVHLFHGLYDGIGVNMLFQAVWRLYNREHDLGQDMGPPFQDSLAHGPLRTQLGAQDFWKLHLVHASTRLLHPSIKTMGNGTISVSRTLEKIEGFETVRRKLHVTHQAVVQACWATVLHSYLGGSVILGVVASGRSIDFEGAERVIGPLFNTLPYQHTLRRRESWASIIEKVHDFNVAAQTFQHTPLRDIMKWVGRSPGEPLFDNLFVYQIADEDQEWAKNDVWQLEDDEPDADYSLALEVEQHPDGTLKVQLVAQQAVLDHETTDLLLDEFEWSLRAAVDNPRGIVELDSASTNEVSENGVTPTENNSTSCMDGASDFEWSSVAQAVREELARLAGVEVEDIQETTSIFELGLDSIDAIRLSSALKKRDIHLPVSEIMRNLTIASMATKVSESSMELNGQTTDTRFEDLKAQLEAALRKSDTVTNDVETILPATPLQEAMMVEMLASEYTEYYNHDVLELAPNADLHRLRASLSTVVQGSPILRTALVEVDDPNVESTFAQVVYRTPHHFWKAQNVNREPDFSEVIDTIRKDVVNQKSRGPLFHVNAIETPSHKYLIISIAHALYDGWSLSLLHSDLYKAYSDQYKPRPKYEPALREIMTASGADAASFWQEFLSGATVTSFERRKAINGEDLQCVHRVERRSKAKLAHLVTFVKKQNISLQALGQTVYILVLASYVRTLDVTFGCVVSGRDNEQMSEVLFPTMNTVAIRAVLHGSRAEMLQYVQDNLLKMRKWQHFPLRKAQALAGVHGRLFDSLFIYQKSQAERKAQEMPLYESVGGHSNVDYPVCVEMEVVDDQLVWRCAIKDEVFNRDGVDDFIDRLDAVLKALIEERNAPTIEYTSTGVLICDLPPFSIAPKPEESHGTTTSQMESHHTSDSVSLRVIREVLAQASRISEGEINDDMTIFHIGLDSISAMKVSSLLRKRSIKLAVSDLLKVGKISDLARLADQRMTEAEDIMQDAGAVLRDALQPIDLTQILQEAGIDQDDVEAVLPVTPGQMYMLTMWHNSGDTMFYSEFVYLIEEDMSFDDLCRSWGSVVSANYILRTHVVPIGDARNPWIQVVRRDAVASITDLTGKSEDAAPGTMNDAVLRQPYAHLIVTKTRKGWHLRLKIHHALYDGVSLPLLMEQFKHCCSGREPRMSSLSTYESFLASQSNAATVNERTAFWKKHLDDTMESAIRQPTSPIQSRTEVFQPALIGDLEPMDSLLRKRGVSTQSLFIATYARVYASLANISPNHDIVIGLYLANRSHPIPDLPTATFPTVNLVPLRVKRPQADDIWAVVDQVHQDMQEISNPVNSTVSLFEVSEWTGVRIDTFVNFLRLPDAEPKEAGARVGEEEDAIKVSQVGKWDERIARVTDVAFGKLLPGIDENADRVAEAYLVRSFLFVSGNRNLLILSQHAIDIEATICNGALDMGVFGPTEMLGLQEAKEIVEKVLREIERAVEIGGCE